MPTWEIVVGIVAALGGVVGGLTGVAALIQHLSNRRQIKASAKKTDVERLEIVVKTLSAEYERLTADHAKLRDRVRTVEAENSELSEQVSRLQRQVEHWKTRYRKLWVWAKGCGLEPPGEEPEEGEDGEVE